MQTIEFLQHHSLAELTERFRISAKRHGEFPNLVMLNYSQIDSPMAETIVQECRGLILDEADGWRVVSRAYDKFFNYGEPNAAEIDWSTAVVYEKLDGSLMTMYHYAGAWRVASSGLPDAGGPVNNRAGTFASLFWETWGGLGSALPGDVSRNYIFELMTPANRVIVPHRQSRIVLHGCRYVTPPYQEIAPEHAAIAGWEVVRSFPLSSLADCLRAADTLDPMQCEGYVVRDAHFRRLKVKGPQYVAMAHLKDRLTPRRLLEVIRANESTEFLTYFPEWRESYDAARVVFESLCERIESIYQRLKEIPSQKEFAAEAVREGFASSALFALRGGKCKSAREFYAMSTMQSLVRAIGEKALEALDSMQMNSGR